MPLSLQYFGLLFCSQPDRVRLKLPQIPPYSLHVSPTESSVFTNLLFGVSSIPIHFSTSVFLGRVYLCLHITGMLCLLLILMEALACFSPQPHKTQYFISFRSCIPQALRGFPAIGSSGHDIFHGGNP